MYLKKKQSLHAIKDEMYLRQNLQKNSVQLAYASIAYTVYINKYYHFYFYIIFFNTRLKFFLSCFEIDG